MCVDVNSLKLGSKGGRIEIITYTIIIRDNFH
jgi:hypothetical protein